jgi:hypothetical protein
MQQIIQLTPEDDITSIRAKIESAEFSRVVLVVPRGCAALANDRGLQLLRRAAEDAGLQLGLVTHDYQVHDRAGAFGFPVFNSIAQAQHSQWRMEPLSPDVVQGTPRGSAVPGTHQASASTDLFRQWWGVVAVGIVACFVLCALATVFVPTATVRLVPSALALSVSGEILADPSITQVNSETRSVPARRITEEISGTLSLKTTTDKSIPNAPSTGTVIFSNMRGEDTLVPQGTIVMTSAGVPIRFTTVTTATIPAGVSQRVEVPIQAVEPGPTGNVKELAINSIEGPLAISAKVINLKPTASGTLKPVKVVTADDKKKLEAQLLQLMRQQGYDLLRKSLKTNEFMPAEAVLLDVGDEMYDHSVDDPSDTLNLRIVGTAFGLAIDYDDVDVLTRALLEKQLQKGYQLLPSEVQADTLPGGKYQGIALRLPVRGVGYATPQIDTNKVAAALQGKTMQEAEAYLSSAINLGKPPEISISPIGWNRFPWLGFRIAVFVDQPAQPK